MAWALKDPDGFGQYWPRGNFTGWNEQLEAYVHGEMPAEEKARVWDGYRVLKTPVCDKFDKDRGPVVSQESPEFYQTLRNHSSLASMITTQSRLLAVDEALKNIIERFEPGLHQFFPLKIAMPKGQEYPEQYYILIIRQFIEAYIPVEGTFSPHHGGGKNFYALSETKKDYNQLQLSQNAIGSAHLWRDSRLRIPNIFISDALEAAITEAGLKIFRHYKVKEV